MSDQDDPRIETLRKQIQALSRIIIKAQSYAESAPEVALTQARKSAEAICRSLFAREIGEPGDKIMLDELIRRLVERKVLPRKIAVPLGTIQAYGNFSTHAHGDLDDIDAAYAAPCLSALAQVTSWYFVEYLKVDVPKEISESSRGSKAADERLTMDDPNRAAAPVAATAPSTSMGAAGNPQEEICGGSWCAAAQRTAAGGRSDPSHRGWLERCRSQARIQRRQFRDVCGVDHGLRAGRRLRSSRQGPPHASPTTSTSTLVR